MDAAEVVTIVALGIAWVASHAPRLTTVITGDDNIAARFIQSPFVDRHSCSWKTIKVVSLRRCPHLSFFRPTVSTVAFDLFSGGEHAAEVLGRAFLVGDSATNVIRPGKIVAENTIGPRNFSERWRR